MCTIWGRILTEENSFSFGVHLPIFYLGLSLNATNFLPIRNKQPRAFLHSGWLVHCHVALLGLWVNSDHGIAVLRVLGSQTDQLWSVVHFSQTLCNCMCLCVCEERDRPVGERSKGLICSISRSLIKSQVSSNASSFTLFFTATILCLKLGLVSGAPGAPGLKLSAVSLSVL